MRSAARRLILSTISLALAFQTSAALAQRSGRTGPGSYPAKPVRFIVPFPPGGGADIIARILGKKLSTVLGQSIVIDNRPGAGGTVGAAIAARAEPDGYTLFLGNSGPCAAAVSLYKKLGYNPVTDFAPVSLVATAPLVLIVKPSLSVKSVPELIALAKSEPGRLLFGFAGVGSQANLAGTLFALLARIRVTNVPYKGGAPAITDLLGGRLTYVFTALPSAMSLIKDKKVRALGVSGTRPSPELPHVPTIKQFLPTYEATGWWAVFVPAGTPRPIISWLHAKITKILTASDVDDYFAREGVRADSSTPSALAMRLKRDIEKWRKVIIAGHIHVRG